MEQENLMAGGGGLAARDLVTTGIFSALYLVFMMVGGMFFASNPVLTFWMPAASALLTGPVYLLLVAKVPKHGPLVVLGVVADVVAGVGGFRNKALNLVAFVVYSLSPMGSYLMLWVDPSGYASYLVGKGAEQAYMDTMFSTATSWMLPAMLVATVACAVVSGLVGMRLLRRQFAKAGMTA